MNDEKNEEEINSYLDERAELLKHINQYLGIVKDIKCSISEIEHKISLKCQHNWIRDFSLDYGYEETNYTCEKCNLEKKLVLFYINNC